ncbi:MAG TPA: hypothetical protein VHD81_09180 [Mycobacteriales bacterium]|nr:hypothetical protein [Mycobacteriales bacterium]
MSGLFREQVTVTYVDPDNNELATSWETSPLPRVGENVRIANVPYVVERIGYDLPKDKIERVWIVLRHA